MAGDPLRSNERCWRAEVGCNRELSGRRHRQRPLPHGCHRTEGVTMMQLPGEPIEMVVA